MPRKDNVSTWADALLKGKYKRPLTGYTNLWFMLENLGWLDVLLKKVEVQPDGRGRGGGVGGDRTRETPFEAEGQERRSTSCEPRRRFCCRRARTELHLWLL